MAFVESLHRWQKDTPVLVVSEQLALENVIRAIRVGVKDLFHPPIDLRAIVERIYSVLKPELGTTRSARLDDWRELTVQLTDSNAAPPVHGSGANWPGSATPLPTAGGKPDPLARELKAAREALADAKSRQSELEQEVARLRTAKPAFSEAQKPAADNQLDGEISAARGKLENEQNLLAEQRRKFAAECAAQASREQALAEKGCQLTAAQEKLQNDILLLAEARKRLEEEGAAAGKTVAIQKETEAKSKRLVIEQAALAEAQERHGRECAVWQTVRTKAEVELARREQKVVQAQADAKHPAADDERFDAAQSSLPQAIAKLGRERAPRGNVQTAHQEAIARTRAREEELAHALQALAAKEKLHAAAAAQLATEQEEWKSQFTADRAALYKAAAARRTEAEQLMAQLEQFAAETRQVAEQHAERENQLARREGELAPRNAKLAAVREKMEAEQLIASRVSVKAANTMNEAEALRAELQQRTRELADKEAALQETEVQMQTRAAQNLITQAQIDKVRIAHAADKVALEQESAALAEQVWMFETRKWRIREQIKQLLAAS